MRCPFCMWASPLHFVAVSRLALRDGPVGVIRPPRGLAMAWIVIVLFGAPVRDRDKNFKPYIVDQWIRRSTTSSVNDLCTQGLGLQRWCKSCFPVRIEPLLYMCKSLALSVGPRAALRSETACAVYFHVAASPRPDYVRCARTWPGL